MAFLSQSYTDLNTNSVGAKTASLDITAQTIMTWRIVPNSGAHNNHRISLRGSFDNVTFFPLKSTLEGANVMSTKINLAIGYIKFRVSTAEGAVSTVDILVNAK